MSELGLGTAQLGCPYGLSNHHGRPSYSEAAAILGCAVESGIRVIDTASVYGKSEALIGRLLPDDAGSRVFTKTEALECGEVTNAACEIVRRSVLTSLQRLRRESLDGLLLHNVSALRLRGGDRLARCLAEMRDGGVTQAVGVSIYGPEDLEIARNYLPLDVVQLPINVFDQRFVNDGTLEMLCSEGVEVHVRSVFLQGLLLMKPEDLPNNLAAAAAPLRRYRQTCSGHGLSGIEAALGFVREMTGVDVILVGANSAAELKECIIAMSKHPEPEIDFAALDVDDTDVIDPRRWDT